MEHDARVFAGETRLQADVCIIGAGPAGITLARELAGGRGSVILLESGGADQPDRDIQALNDGVVIGSAYAGLGATRHRRVGGTAHLWNTSFAGRSGAKYVALDHIDFEPRADLPLSGWPFDRGHLDPYYRRAHAICGLGTFDDDAIRWAASSERPCLPARDADDLATRVYHVGTAQQFTVTHPAILLAAENVRLVHHATCCALLTDGARRIVGVAAKSSTRQAFRVDARFVVIAGGAIENARLLLASGGGDDALGNRHGWVGRCFMEHPRDYALRLIPRSGDVFREITFYDLHRSRGDAWIIGRLGLGASTLRSSGFPNASVTLLPRRRRRPWIDAFDRAMGPIGIPFVRRPATVGYGWADTAVEKRCDALQVLINLEQRPHPDNRVVLASERDALGVPRAELHWRWRDEEQATLGRLRAHLAERLSAIGLGRAEVSRDAIPDPNAHHHSGTTRMSVDPRQGVVDADGRVHGTDNLFVAGSSVFPTAGFANPTLTIVALAVRLADHLEAML